MPYQINTTVSFIIDGSELNAGNRMFARDHKFFAIDGVEIGTAAIRQFLRDHRTFAITGMGGVGQDRPGVMQTVTYAVTGRASDDGAYAYPATFEISGTPGNFDVVAPRSTCSFVIDNVTQETPPT